MYRELISNYNEEFSKIILVIVRYNKFFLISF